MYGDESKEDGEIKFHYKRGEWKGSEAEEQKKSLFWRLFRMNRSTMIILLDVLVLTVVFMIFRPMMARNDHILETDTYTARLSGFLFNEKAYVNFRVKAMEDNSGGQVTVRVWAGEEGEKAFYADTAPEKEGVEWTARFEIAAEGEDNHVHAEVTLPDMNGPAVLTALLKE